MSRRFGTAGDRLTYATTNIASTGDSTNIFIVRRQNAGNFRALMARGESDDGWRIVVKSNEAGPAFTKGAVADIKFNDIPLTVNVWYVLAFRHITTTNVVGYRLDMSTNVMTMQDIAQVSAINPPTDEFRIGDAFLASDNLDGDLFQVIHYNADIGDAVLQAIMKGFCRYPYHSNLQLNTVLWGVDDPEPDYGPNGNTGIVVGTPAQTDQAPVPPLFGFDLHWHGDGGGVPGPLPIGRTKGITRRRSDTLLVAGQRDDADGNPTDEYLLLRTDEFGRIRVAP